MDRKARPTGDGTARGESVPLTPSDFLETMAAHLDRLHAGTAGVQLHAIPVKTGGTGRVYGGFIYAALRDPWTEETIDARVPEEIAASLEWNHE